MKKIITLLVAVVTLFVAQAQTSKEEARKVVLGERKNSGNESARGRDVVLGGGNRENRNDRNSYPESSSENAVNREYDNKIASIRNNSYLSADEKEKMIRQLEKDRAKKLKEYRKGYKKDHDDDDDYKTNKGKHKGWTKGKGNQKKNKH